MQTRILKIAVLIQVASGLFNPAFGQEWSVPDHGFTIDIETPQGIPQKSGSTAKIVGRVDLVGAHLKGQGLGKSGDDFHWKVNTRQKEIGRVPRLVETRG